MRIAVSACLCGEAVRFDGKTKIHNFVKDKLCIHAELVSFCPEVSAGLGIPRPPVHIRVLHDHIRVLSNENSNHDVTSALQTASKHLMDQIRHCNGVILKARSPSCGLRRTPYFSESDDIIAYGSGIFTRSLKQYLPTLSLIEDDELADDTLREHFIICAALHADWQRLPENTADRVSLKDFHHSLTLLLLAYPERERQDLDNIVATHKNDPSTHLRNLYGSQLFYLLTKPISQESHVRILRHTLSRLGDLADAQSGDLIRVIDHYQSDSIPLVQALMSLREACLRSGQNRLAQQRYLNPGTSETALRTYPVRHDTKINLLRKS